jgi:hypothetical protein
MKIIQNQVNQRWYDENKNSWLTEETATQKSPTLRHCSDCSDCSDCSYCSNCSDCSNCFYCSNCSRCSRCSNCSDCSNCSNCSRCSYCFDCSYCSDCSRCSNCSDCSYCSNCSNCSYCFDCSDFRQNPARYFTTQIGSRSDQTKFYWTTKNDLQIVCGCFKGNLEDFKNKVLATYPLTTQHGKDYTKVINMMEQLILI